ncbi:hypothetical protein [Caudoviricetes sp.]|nr:hypothetical protein [Caudoviricetes sp.]
MRRKDRFDNAAEELVFENMAFQAALEKVDNAEMANVIAQWMCDRYGNEGEQAARDKAAAEYRQRIEKRAKGGKR